MNYKKNYDGEASAIITDAYIFTNFKPGDLPDLKFFTPVAAWDAGAEYTSISTEVIEALHLKPKEYTTIQVFGADLDEYSILLGMDIITRTDFLITNKDGKTTFQFCTPSEGGVEF